MLGKWTEYLKDIAGFLEIIEKDTAVNTSTMVVKKGNNSSDWNAAAGAWNKVRTNWITLLINLGLDQVLETHCPGKVLRLMAADLMRWH